MHKYQRLKDLREDANLTQKEFAEKMQMTQQQYSEYERGIREIPFYKIIEIAKFYNVSIDYIAGLTRRKEGIKNYELDIDDICILENWKTLTEREKGQVDYLINEILSKKGRIIK